MMYVYFRTKENPLRWEDLDHGELLEPRLCLSIGEERQGLPVKRRAIHRAEGECPVRIE